MEKPKISIEQNNKRMTEEVLEMIHRNSMTADDALKAYEIALGIEGGNKEGVVGPISELSGLFKKYIDQGIPLNKIADLISSGMDFEGLEDSYYWVVDGLNTSGREKRILKSLVNNPRPGELLILNPKSEEEILKITILPNVKEEKHGSKQVAGRLIPVFQKLKDREIEITFIQ